ncbi:Uncharacterised protein [Klebsiella pneumoniae]|nr:Uncharacterised protein [Klebsiella pneumoniae]
MVVINPREVAANFRTEYTLLHKRPFKEVLSVRHRLPARYHAEVMLIE